MNLATIPRRVLRAAARLAASAPIVVLAAFTWSYDLQAMGPGDLAPGELSGLQIPAPDRLQALVEEWARAKGLDEPTTRQMVEAVLGATGAEHDSVLDRVTEAFAIADPRVRAWLDRIHSADSPTAAAPPDWLDSPDLPAWEALHLKLYAGRWLILSGLVDEGLALLAPLNPDDVVDPAALLFFQGVAHHRLLHKEDGLKALGRLLEDVQGGPRRYQSLATLMQADLSALEEDSLDHISRRMGDIERRLVLGRAGPTVRRIEDGVIEDLDKLIEEMEKQRQQQQGGGTGPGSNQSNRPAQDSAPMGGRGEGQVDKKPIGDEAGWGDLPPRKREEALQEIGKDFPPHYREIIEQYFRKLASPDARPNGG
jgi:hypothetical protein